MKKNEPYKGEHLLREADDRILLDYDKQELTLIWKDNMFTIDLKQGDVGDFWHSIEVDMGEYYDTFDINFHQEDEAQVPTVDIYDLVQDENGTYTIGDNIDSISGDKVFTRGDQSNYFDRILEGDYTIEKDVTRIEWTVTLWGREYSIITEEFHGEGGIEVWKVNENRPLNEPSSLAREDRVRTLIQSLFDEGKLNSSLTQSKE